MGGVSHAVSDHSSSTSFIISLCYPYTSSATVEGHSPRFPVHCWISPLLPLYLCHFPLKKKWANGLPYFIVLRQKRRSRGENSIFLGPASGGGDMTCWREEATHWPSEVSVQRAAADGQATRWIWMRAVKRVMRQGRPPPLKPMQAWTMRAVFHWKHWEPALAFSQTIEALASCRHGSDAAVKSLFLHPLMN